MSATVTLTDRLDFQAVGPLADELRAIDDAALSIDASNVRHLGTLTLQVILATVKSRHASGKTTTLASPSDACVDQLGLFGFTPETLIEPEAWT